MVTLRKILIVLPLLFLLAATSAAQGKRASWLSGTWEGTGYQTDDNSTWQMRLTIKKLKSGRRSFSIEYPSLSCGGHWQLLSINESKARFRELLDHGQDNCADRGLVIVQRIRRQLIFLYSNLGSSKITASAVLNKSPAR